MASADDNLPGLGKRTLVPRLRSDAPLRKLQLSQSEGYVLSRIDGRTSLWEICLLVPFAREETLRIMRGLRTRGVIEVPGSTEPAEPLGAPGAAPEVARAPAREPAVAPPPAVREPAPVSEARRPTQMKPPAVAPVPSVPVPSVPVSSGPVSSGPVSSGPVPSGPVSSGPVPSGRAAPPVGAPVAPVAPPAMAAAAFTEEELRLVAAELSALADGLQHPGLGRGGRAPSPSAPPLAAPPAPPLAAPPAPPLAVPPSPPLAVPPAPPIQPEVRARPATQPPRDPDPADTDEVIALGPEPDPELSDTDEVIALGPEPDPELSDTAEVITLGPEPDPFEDIPAVIALGPEPDPMDGAQRGGSPSIDEVPLVISLGPEPEPTPAAPRAGTPTPAPPPRDWDGRGSIRLSRSSFAPPGPDSVMHDEPILLEEPASLSLYSTPSSSSVAAVLEQRGRSPQSDGTADVAVLRRSAGTPSMVDDTRPVSRRSSAPTPGSASGSNPPRAAASTRPSSPPQAQSSGPIAITASSPPLTPVSVPSAVPPSTLPAAPTSTSAPPTGASAPPTGTSAPPTGTAAPRAGVSAPPAGRSGGASIPLMAQPTGSPAHRTRGVVGPVVSLADARCDLTPEQRRRIDDIYEQLNQVDAFTLLGITQQDDKKALQRAYFRLSKEFHPDRYFKKELGIYRPRVAAIFQAITEARDTLIDEERRAAYMAGE